MRRGRWVLVIFCVIMVISILVAHNSSYNNAVDNLMPPTIQYDCQVISGFLNADYYTLLSIPKRKIYFGRVPNDSDGIRINIPFKATLCVYPHTAESVLVRYEPSFGFKTNYMLSGANFNNHLEVLYKITGNEVFNESIELLELE